MQFLKDAVIPKKTCSGRMWTWCFWTQPRRTCIGTMRLNTRGGKEVKHKALCRAGRYQKVAENLKVKEVHIDDRRYVVCRNEEEAR